MPHPLTLLVLSPSTGGYYFGEVLTGIAREMASVGGRIVLVQTLELGVRSDVIGQAPDFSVPVCWDEIDGVISITTAVRAEYLRALQKAGMPVVLASTRLPGLDVPIAMPDNHGGTVAAVEHLIAHGHTRIGFLGNLRQTDIRDRYEAYRQTLAGHGLTADPADLFPVGDNAESGGTDAVPAFLACEPRPTAVMAATDRNGIGFLETVTALGVRVPDDLAVVGFDNIEASVYTTPPLTSVDQPFDHLGALAARLALAQIRGEQVAPVPHTSPATVIARGSCGCAASRATDEDAADGHASLERSPMGRDARRAEAMARMRRPLLTAPGPQGDPMDTQVAAIMAEVDRLTAAGVDAPPADIDTLMASLRLLAPRPDALRQVVRALTEYIHRVGSAQAVGVLGSALSNVRAGAFIEQSRSFELKLEEQFSVDAGLLDPVAPDPQELTWLSQTHVRAGALALWEGPPAEGTLRIVGLYDPDGHVDGLLGTTTSVEHFPPRSLVASALPVERRLYIVVPVRTRDREWGLLAVNGEIETTSAMETYHHWAALLGAALREKGLLEDIRRSEERYAFASRAANDGLWEFDLTSGAIYLSQRCRDLLDLQGDLDRSTWLDIVHPEDRASVSSVLTEAASCSDKPVEVEFRVPRRDGTANWLLVRVLGVASTSGAVERLVGSLSDIDQRKLLEEQLRQAALFDTVTGLPNRRLFLDRLEMSMQQPCRRRAARFAVLFLDLDSFKLINDSLGHLMGDELLRIVGERLREDLRSVDTAARFGGDEFALLLADPVPDDLLVVARRIQDRISAPVLLGDQQVSVTASIGIAASETGYTVAEDVLRDADISMYQAKESARGTACLFDPGMHERALDRLRTRSALTAALEAHQFVVHYQPIVDLGGADVTQFEALVRWQHPERGLLAPAAFLPAMEGNATIIALGRQVLEDVCAQIAAWRQDHRTVSVAVNLSHRQFWDPELLPTIRSILELHGVPSECLIIEITESVIMTDPTEARTIMDALHKIGLLLHIDDFGTGHSSLNVLRTFPVDALKIDGSFVRELALVDQTTALVRTIVAMGQALGIEVVAECVETHEQAAELRAMGCTTAQGWLYARALPADDAGDILGTRLSEHEVAVPSGAGGPSLSS